MMNLFRRITVVAVVFACCFTCNYSFAAGSKQAEYTMILYLNGCDLESDTNRETNQLSGEASDALNALQKSSFDDSKLNVIVITGGTNKWRQESPKISTTQCQAWRIWGEPEKKMELVADTDPTMSMMDKNTLAEYISWAIKTYPAKKYALLMWDHGAGPIGGFGTDELNGNKSLSISDIQKALKSSLGKNKLELIAFTCCLMGNFETAYKLKDYANYMVGSEDLSYGDAFEGLMEGLANKPSMSGKDLGKIFINAHFKGYDGRLYTFSLVDLSKMEEIKNNWDVVIQELSAKMKGNSKASADMYRYLAAARAFSESYNERARNSDGITDMYHFAELISQKCKINTDGLKKSIKDAVLYNKVCKSRTNSNGLSIFFVERKLDPNLGLQDNLIKYRPGCSSKVYYDFVTGYYDKLFVKDPTILIGSINFIQTQKDLSPGAIEDTTPNSYPPNYRVKIDLSDVELVNQVWFVIGKMEGDGNDQKFKALSIDKEVDFKPAKGEVSVSVTGKGYCIGGKPIPIYWDGDINRRKDPKYFPVGSFAVKYKGETKFLVVQEKSKDVAEIIGAWDSNNYNGNVIPVLTQLDPNDRPKIGDKVTILYKAFGKYEDGPEVTLDSYTITKANLENGEYCGAFYIEDIIGRKIWSYRKGFDINSTTEVKDTRTRGSVAPMSEDESL